MASSRSEDAAISSALATPRAVSISTSIPVRFSRPCSRSISTRICSTKRTSKAEPALGSSTKSSRGARDTTSTMSRSAQGVSRPLTRRAMVFGPQSSSFSARTAFSRA